MRKKKKVLIAGGGPGGMEAARILAQRGHEVILCEKTSALGGRLPEASSLWLKDGFRRYFDYAVRKTLSCGAEVRLNTPVTPELVLQEKPDTLILALGAKEFRPPIPGADGPNVVSVVDVDRGRVSTGQKVVVCGGGLSGAECAMALGREGKQVTVVDLLPEEELHKNISEFNLPILLKRLRDNRVELRYETAVKEIGEKGVLVSRGGTEEWLEADTVVAAFGIRADRAELDSLRDLVPETYVIGDAHKVGVIGDATNDAWRVCLQID
jgi:NADPH-dependent 2,4-dienoyl-CoA reductase/sulfur reductase-like enzyme